MNILENFPVELQARVPEINIDGVINIKSLPTDGMLSFLEFWDTVDLAIGSKDHAENEDDEVRCLKVLREKLLREYRLSPSNERCVSNDRLLKILRDVRESASDKKTWDDAIRSAETASGAPKDHSLDTLAAAVKLMVDEYLWEVEHGTPVQTATTPIAPPQVFCDPLEDQLRAEIDNLRSKLTESECSCSELMESNKRLNREISILKDDMERVSKNQQAIVPSPDSSVKLKTAEEKVRVNQLELEKLKAQNASLISELKSGQSQLQAIQNSKISPSVSSDSLPTLAEWKVIHAKLAFLLASSGESTSTQLSLIESLMSQVQTLETQKTDADAEITRLSKLLISSQLTTKLPSSALRQRAEDFVGSATASSVSSRRSVTKKKPKKFSDKNEYSINNCVQQ